MNVNKITGSTDWTFQTLNLKSNKQESLLVDPLIQWFYNVNPLNNFLLGLPILILLITHNFLKREKDKYLLQYPKERLRVHLRILPMLRISWAPVLGNGKWKKSK